MSVSVELADAYDRTVAVLTDRERKIGHLWASGRTTRQIGTLLHITSGTADTTIRVIYEKLAITSRDELRAKFAQGSRPVARSPRTAAELALFLAVADAERVAPQDADVVRKLWRTKAYATTRAQYTMRANGVLTFLEVLPTPGLLDG